MRKELIELLRGGQAHLTAKELLDGIEPAERSARHAEGFHTLYEELEHMRIAQEDILRYTLDPNWKSPPWPEGYWPSDNDSLTDERWEESLSGFQADLQELVDLARDPGRDPSAEIPHGEGRTYLREILLAADHNAYHLGKMGEILKTLRAGKGRGNS